MSCSNPTRRRQLLVDSQVQGALLWRVPLYWACFVSSILLLQACWIVLTRQAASSGQLLHVLWVHNAPALMASLLLLPILMLDCVRLSNRFVGPIVRLRRHLRQLAAGEETGPMKLREGDFWQSLAEDYNAALVRVQQPCAVEPAAESAAPVAVVLAMPSESMPVSTS